MGEGIAIGNTRSFLTWDLEGGLPYADLHRFCSRMKK